MVWGLLIGRQLPVPAFSHVPGLQFKESSVREDGSLGEAMKAHLQAGPVAAQSAFPEVEQQSVSKKWSGTKCSSPA